MRVRIEGEISIERARSLVVSLCEMGRTDLTLDLLDTELDSGAACAAMVDLTRMLLERHDSVTLEGAPQALAHVLYRVGMLDRIKLVDVRSDEPTVT